MALGAGWVTKCRAGQCQRGRSDENCQKPSWGRARIFLSPTKPLGLSPPPPTAQGGPLEHQALSPLPPGCPPFHSPTCPDPTLPSNSAPSHTAQLGQQGPTILRPGWGWHGRPFIASLFFIPAHLSPPPGPGHHGLSAGCCRCPATIHFTLSQDQLFKNVTAASPG